MLKQWSQTAVLLCSVIFQLCSPGLIPIFYPPRCWLIVSELWTSVCWGRVNACGFVFRLSARHKSLITLNSAALSAEKLGHQQHIQRPPFVYEHWSAHSLINNNIKAHLYAQLDTLKKSLYSDIKAHHIFQHIKEPFLCSNLISVRNIHFTQILLLEGKKWEPLSLFFGCFPYVGSLMPLDCESVTDTGARRSMDGQEQCCFKL